MGVVKMGLNLNNVIEQVGKDKGLDKTILIEALDEAHELDPEAVIGDSLGIKLDTSEFGRIAAQTAKQIIIQKVREAERNIVYNEYTNKKGEIVTGIVHTFERGDILVDMGRAE